MAGAGSGKTKTITYRIAHIVKNCGVSPHQILGISFTNKAAGELRERVHHLVGAVASKMTLTTFHSLGLQILRREIVRLGRNPNFSIYDQSDQIAIIREGLQSYRGEQNFKREWILSKISWLKNQNLGAQEYATSSYFDPDDPYHLATEFLYRYYQERLYFYNAVDFDDLLFLPVQIFQQFPEIATSYGEKFRYIMVDEYQDTNHPQLLLVLALTQGTQNICVVGDDDQAIYAFRGANLQNILEFEKSFPGAQIFKLEENYRSTNEILALANGVIKQNKHRKDKTLFSQSSGPLPLLWKMQDSEHEAQIIVEEILQHQSAGHLLSEIAVLYRSNTQTPLLEEHLRLSQVPYQLLGGQKFYDRKEIKDLLAYLTVIANPQDEIALRRILNVPARGIGLATLEKFLAASKARGTSLFSVLASSEQETIKNFVHLISEMQNLFGQLPLATALSKLIEKLDYFAYVEKSYDHHPVQMELRRNHILDLIAGAERFARYHGAESASANTLLKTFLERILLQDTPSSDLPSTTPESPANTVTLMTLHGSKGLEFSTVFLVGVEEDLLPHKRTVSEGTDINEELRLAYVGITRAKRQLIMTYCKERLLYGKKVPRRLSRFFQGQSALYKEQDRTCFGHLAPEQVAQYKQKFFANLLDQLE